MRNVPLIYWFLLIILPIGQALLQPLSFVSSRINLRRQMCDQVADSAATTVRQTHSQQSLDAIRAQITRIRSDLESTERDLSDEQATLDQLEQEYGPEIARVKKEFARMKERSYEESAAAVKKARVEAIREILPLTDNYLRAKKVFEPLDTSEVQQIGAAYDHLFGKFSSILRDFGVERVESLGQPFDVKFMDAIMTSPSSDYAEGFVCNEYQVGYRMGDSCVRPAMVAVSLGPGPS